MSQTLPATMNDVQEPQLASNLEPWPEVQSTEGQPAISSRRIDFATLPGLEEYSTFYAMVYDNVFTATECAALIARTDGAWIPAGLSTTDGQTVHSSFRNSDRMLLLDGPASSFIYERLFPLVEQDIGVIRPGNKFGEVIGKPAKPNARGSAQRPGQKLVRVNERLSFLRYDAAKGHFFKRHCDGLVDTPDGCKSFVTLHVYLNGGGDDPLEGGATRFHSRNGKAFVDVEPVLGRVLVFQQRMLLHSGEEVAGGVKFTLRSDFLFEPVRSAGTA